MEKLIKRKSIIKGQLTKIKNDVTSNGRDMTYDALRARLDKVNDLYNSFIEIEDAIFSLNSMEESEMNTIDEIYFEIVSTLQTYIREKSMQTAIAPLNETVFNNTINNNAHSDFKLPRLSLPTFDGNLKEWQSFYDLFTSTVHENTSLSAAQKFKYLKGQLKGTALDLVKHFRVDDHNYNEAFQRLVKRYNKKKPIVESFIREFLNQPKFSKASSTAITQIHDCVDETVRGLKALGKGAEDRDPWIIFLTLEKLDEDTRRLWKYESSETEFPTIDQLLDFLMKRMDSLMDVPSKNSQTKSQSSVKSFLTTSDASSQQSCPFCTGQSHRLCDCLEFKKMNVSGRRDYIKKSNRCFNCLSDKHAVFQCRNRTRCLAGRCGKKHHTLLHNEVQPSQINLQSSSQSITEKSSSSNTQASTSKESPSNSQSKPCSYITHTENLTESNLSNCYRATANTSLGKILPTALIEVRDRFGSWHIARALLDSASTHSFVTSSFVNRLHLPRKSAKFSVTTLNNIESCGTKGITDMLIRSRWDNGFSCNVNALVLTSITTSLPAQSIDMHQMQHIHSLQLADPTFHQPNPIDILLGCDHFFMCLTDGKRFENQDLPVAQNSKLGWLIGGSFPTSSSLDVITMMSCPEHVDIDKTLQRFWEVEELPIKVILSEEEQNCLKITNPYRKINSLENLQSLYHSGIVHLILVNRTTSHLDDFTR